MGVPYSVILVSSILTLGTCAQNTSASITGCRPQCEIAVSALTWNWRSASITSSIVYATVLYITDDVDGTVRTSTLLNELPSGITVPSLNQAGTHVEQATVETAKGRFTTIELAFPTRLTVQELAYTWAGTVPTYDMMGNFVCSTASSHAPMDLVDFTATISRGSFKPAPSDLEGLNYYFEQGYQSAYIDDWVLPLKNQNDGAFRYCQTSEVEGEGVAAQRSVVLLTVTSNRHERRSPTTSQATSASSNNDWKLTAIISNLGPSGGLAVHAVHSAEALLSAGIVGAETSGAAVAQSTKSTEGVDISLGQAVPAAALLQVVSLTTPTSAPSMAPLGGNVAQASQPAVAFDSRTRAPPSNAVDALLAANQSPAGGAPVFGAGNPQENTGLTLVPSNAVDALLGGNRPQVTGAPVVNAGDLQQESGVAVIQGNAIDALLEPSRQPAVGSLVISAESLQGSQGMTGPRTAIVSQNTPRSTMTTDGTGIVVAASASSTSQNLHDSLLFKSTSRHTGAGTNGHGITTARNTTAGRLSTSSISTTSYNGWPSSGLRTPYLDRSFLLLALSGLLVMYIGSS